jgi:tRNA 5-methylaminomethyl-2-thiouridine biosynthesis bifunctional protein
LRDHDLRQHLSQLQPYQYCCVDNVGFGNALNILALWQLWQQCRPNNHSRLHVISTEKHPLSSKDLQHTLAAFPSLKPLADQLIAQYPPILLGCHRLIFATERFSIDLRFGDSAATAEKSTDQQQAYHHSTTTIKIPTIAIVGAGIAGLSIAHALSNRGVAVTLIDEEHPLAGASGNPRALLAPQPIAIEKFADNLMNIGGLFSIRYWQQYPSVVTLSNLLFFSEKKQQEQWDKIRNYPTDFLQSMTADQASAHSQTSIALPAIEFKQAALLNPKALCNHVLSNPLVTVKQAQIDKLVRSDDGQWQLLDAQGHQVMQAKHVIVCNARFSQQLCPMLPALNAIRGQVSWATLDQAQHHLSCALSYGGYVAPINNAQQQPILLFGASFIKGDLSTDVTAEDHQHNYDLLAAVAPEVAQQLPEQPAWQGRASIRAQTNDYLPIVGEIPDMPQVWTLTALGSKGFSFAPLCAEVICAQLLNEALPISTALAKAISPRRFVKKVRERKPYYSGPLSVNPKKTIKG